MNEPGRQNGSAAPDPSIDPKWEAAVFGREVKNFVEGDPIGAYLVQRARADLEAAQTALLEVDPSDAKQIATLQLDARVANRVRGWLAEAIQNGIDAEILIQQERDEHGS